MCISQMHIHLLYLQALYIHTRNHIRKEGHHIIIAHRHIRHNLFQRDLLRGVILVLLPPEVELLSQLRHLALSSFG